MRGLVGQGPVAAPHLITHLFCWVRNGLQAVLFSAKCFCCCETGGQEYITKKQCQVTRTSVGPGQELGGLAPSGEKAGADLARSGHEPKKGDVSRKQAGPSGRP